MDGPGGHYGKWNKLGKDKCHMISLICEILKTKTKTPNYDTENKWVASREAGSER